MGTAVCIRCGSFKASPFVACPNCRFDPRGDRRAMAQSLMLSDAYYDPETDHRPTKADLQEASHRITTGGEVAWDEIELTKLMAEQQVLDEAGSPSWLKIAVLLVLLLLVPLLAVLVFILRRLV
jgi:hypothetical protein